MIRAAVTALALVLTATGCGSGGGNVRSGAQAPLHDPLVMFARMDRATIHIIRGTASMSDPDYQRTRPRLALRLQRLEFSTEQAQQILVRVDEARADRARLRRWWAALDAGDRQQARR